MSGSKQAGQQPSSEPIKLLALEAYISGWSLSGGPWTARVEAGSIAAVECAAECADDPAVLETSLILGSLEGVWATIYQRRARLQAKHERAVLAAWKTATAGLDPADVVAVFRREAYMTAEAATRDPTRRWWQELGAAAALGWLRKLYSGDGYGALVAALADAIRSGMAEGEAGALALAASKQGKVGFKIDQAFKAAYDRLANDQQITRKAADTATRMIDATAGDTGRRLAKLAGDGADQQDMTSGVEDVMNDHQAVDTGTDWSFWAAVGLGALALYQSIGTGAGGGQAGDIASLIWVDAGDSRVCPACQANADNSPYTIRDAPEMPAHPRCRCSWDTSGAVPAAFLDDFLS